jgi:L-ascorbate metabolism protein UlaG (beta-lactamase superfamily)
MQLTTFGHSCLRLVDGDTVLVIDPGALSDATTALDEADAVLITHEHFDHVDVDAVTSALQANPELHVWAPAGAARTLAGVAGRVTEVLPGEEFTAAGLSVRTFGGQHALIHGSIPVVDNVGYLIEDVLYHPGDAFDVPDVPVAWLGVPTHAPWSKLGEVLDFVTAVRPQQAFQIHDGLLNATGIGNAEGHITRVAARYGTRYDHLDVGIALSL